MPWGTDQTPEVSLTFDSKGDVSGGLIFLYKVKGTGFEQVKTIVVK